MKSERLLEAIGGVRDGFVAEAAPGTGGWRRPAWPKWAALAACLAAAIFVGVRLLPGGTTPPAPTSGAEPPAPTGEPTPPVAVSGSPEQPTPTGGEGEPPATLDGLPMLTLSTGSGDMGMGFEGIMVYDFSELENGNPWATEAELDTLPVYRNTSYTGYGGIPVPPEGEEWLLSLAEQAAEALGMEILSVDQERIGESIRGTDIPGDTIYRVEAETETARVNVNGDGTVGISFQEYVPVPGCEAFAGRVDRETVDSIADTLLEQYAVFHEYEEPMCALSVDYTFAGDQHWQIEGYDGAGTLEDQILSYNFNRIWLAAGEDGLHIIWLYHKLSAAEKLGDYPIITADEALALLREGRYITTVPQEEAPQGELEVVKTELIYRAGSGEETYLPYYRIWVELPRNPNVTMAEGLKRVGAYYVPAVEGKYLTNMPLWDGSFNS